MKELAIQIIHPNCAGIDVGSRFHKVAVSQLLSEVKEFGVYTEDHEKLIIHFRACEITHIAMES